jgi:hypothetical protein
MAIDEPEREALDEYRREIQKMKKDVLNLSRQFQLKREENSDEKLKDVYESLSKVAIYLNDAYSRIENEAIVKASLKSQIVLLKDILVQLPDVVHHHEIQKQIAKLFSDYNKKSF